ncbi:hypothetical protein DL764_006552 [Monosporascus ibericus]|uniref:Uncharacterized protein n=1 Tax=Monosporascus ibericus TaxID=155417 RepID=A0A4Q4T4T7_9PEZI|nr:hypothetical protein DL764_006552 [Monosporascus ibericus]
MALPAVCKLEKALVGKRKDQRSWSGGFTSFGFGPVVLIFRFAASLAGFQATEHGAVARHYVAARQNSNSLNGAIDMFIDSDYSGVSYAALVVDVCPGMTVLALQCTAGPSYVEDEACGSNTAVFTVTHAPDLYSVKVVTETRTMGVDVTVTLQESCAITATTGATCSADINAEAAGTRTGSSAVTTITGSAYTDKIYPVMITGGAEKLSAITGTCENAAPALSVRNIAWCLAGAIGIAGFLAV